MSAEGEVKARDAVIGKLLRLIDSQLADLARMLEMDGDLDRLDNIDYLLGHVREMRDTYPYPD